MRGQSLFQFPSTYPHSLLSLPSTAYKLREYISEHKSSIRSVALGPMDIDAALTKWTMKEIEDAGLPLQLGYASRLEV